MEGQSFDEIRAHFSSLIEKLLPMEDATVLAEFQKCFDSPATADLDKKSAVDQTLRDILLESLINKIDAIQRLIDLSILAGRNGYASTTIPVVLLGDAFDIMTLDQCETLFSYVERNVSVWKEECFFAPCKNNILRICNDLLRRLSRSQNTVFCGRILLFLAKFFPFSERSGLNIVSEFNLENITEYSAEGGEIGEQLNDGEEGENKVKIDYNLYCKFWALQDFFRNPNQCYDRVGWKTFQLHSTNVLSAFSSCKLEETRTNVTGVEEGDVVMRADDESVDETHHFFAKFLTNPKLLSLQLADSNFRRSVLVQFLILFQYLQSTVKFKPENFSLSSAQSDWIKETETQVYKLLEETPQDGKKFAEGVRHMLQREEIWNSWKNDGCKEFKKPESPKDVVKPSPAKKRKLLGDLVRDYNKSGKFYMGNPELTRLWNLAPDNLQACKGDDRNFLPTLESYLENPKDNDSSFEWRALRLLARQSPHFFTLINTSSCKVADYLDLVKRKIQKDKVEVRQEPHEENNQVTEHIENELSEENEAELLKAEQLTPEDSDKNEHKTSTVTQENIKEIASEIGADWKKLANKLGYSKDEIQYFETENASVADQCKAMLQIWFEDDVDASLDNLAYTLEGLEIILGCAAVKKLISANEKAEDSSA